MSFRILKYVLENKTTLLRDGDVVPLTCDQQDGTPMLWVEHNPARNWRSFLAFYLLTTGEAAATIPDTAKYLGTILLSNGKYVLHCYYTKELIPRPNEA